MNPVLKKLQLKTPERAAAVNVPDELAAVFGALKDHCPTDEEINKNADYDFSIAFVKSGEELEQLALHMTDSLTEDGVLWFAYPKKSSKKYTTDISRDDGWEPLLEKHFKPVRQVALDDNWSALRFRHESKIKSRK